MTGHPETICQMLLVHVVGFVSQSALPQKRQGFSGFWQAMLDPLGGSNAMIEATFWAQIGAKFGHVGPC